MRVALFIPCFVNELFPQVGIATLALLQGYGLDVSYPPAQSCCGQPLANNGDTGGERAAALHFTRLFQDYDYVVAPSGSCVSQVRQHYPHCLPQHDAYQALPARVYEIVEFLQDVLAVERLPQPVSFPYTVSLHQSCHALRRLGHATPSELMLAPFSRLENILRLVNDITVTLPQRRDECCGFGGSYCVDEPEVSVAIGEDRVAQHLATGAQFIVGVDSGCLMHMDGIIRRQGRRIRPLHVVEILSGRGGQL